MILVYDGPFICLLAAMIIVYIAYRKDKKELEKLQNKEKEIKQELTPISINDKKDEILKDYLNSYNYKKVAL